MKRYTFSVLTIGMLLFVQYSIGQSAKYVYTVGGGGTSTLDNIPATAANLSPARGICIDEDGDIYLACDLKVFRINSGTGILTRVAGSGGGTSGGDGGPATAAGIKSYGIHVRENSLIIGGYISDFIRKVDLGTGIITALADYSVLGTGEPIGVFEDGAGNVYYSERYHIKRIDAGTGLVTTIAGSSSGGYSGDGGPATGAAVEAHGTGIAFDAVGNLYFSDVANHVIRKVDNSTGYIYTIAGTGVSGFSGDGGPATSAKLNSPHSLAIDILGNIIIGDAGNRRIRMINAATGIITTVAGGGTSTAEGAEALSADIGSCYFALDNIGNMFICAAPGGKVKKITNFAPCLGGGTPILADSFRVYSIERCNEHQFSVVTPHYITGRSIKTDFGDGTTDSSVVLAGIGGGLITITHAFPLTGVYTIKHVLYNGPLIVDTMSYTYNYTFCRTLPIKVFYDGNSNCVKESTESFSPFPVLAEVDSNGVQIDTVSLTSGLNYDAYGTPGDVYKFRLINAMSGGITTSCPISGYINDTLSSFVSSPTKQFGLNCSSVSSFDLGINASVRTGPHRESGAVYVYNLSCAPAPATITVHFSPKFVFRSASHGASVTANSINWSFSGLSTLSSMVRLTYSLGRSTDLPIGDTVHTHCSITPIAGDDNPTNNTAIIIDTVRAAYDPNEVLVSPEGCLPTEPVADTLQYTINFENTGNDTAHNIYVLDTLPNYLEPKSIRILAASATMNISIFKANTFNVVKFDFPNIMLPDSSHHDLCHGGVVFTIKTLSNLPIGAVIGNRAGIYFDDNEVVLTNTAQNIKGCPEPLYIPVNKEPHINIYPNPANNELTIVTEKPDYSSYTIANMVGQQLLQQRFNGIQAQVDVSMLPPGLYYVTLKGEQGSVVKKFVKL